MQGQIAIISMLYYPAICFQRISTRGSSSNTLSHLTCSAGVYFVVCMALLVISLTETVLIVRLVHKQDLQPPVPQWVKYLVLERAPVLFCIHKKHRLCSTLSSQASDMERYKDNNYGTGKVQVKACAVANNRGFLQCIQ